MKRALWITWDWCFCCRNIPKKILAEIRCEEIVDSSQEMYCLKMFCRIFSPKILGEERSLNAFWLPLSIHGWQNQPPRHDTLGSLHPFTCLDASHPKRFTIGICQRIVGARENNSRILGGSSQLDPVVSNYDDRKSPPTGEQPPLPNGLFMASTQGLLATGSNCWTGMALQVGRRETTQPIFRWCIWEEGNPAIFHSWHHD